MTPSTVGSWSALIGDAKAATLFRVKAQTTALGAFIFVALIGLAAFENDRRLVEEQGWVPWAIVLSTIVACYLLPLCLLRQWRLGKTIVEELRASGVGVDGAAPLSTKRSFLKWCKKFQIDPVRAIAVSRE